jgi:hypothetical protein
MLALIISPNSALTAERARFESYKVNFGKIYAHDEEHRFANFRAALSAIKPAMQSVGHGVPWRRRG